MATAMWTGVWNKGLTEPGAAAADRLRVDSDNHNWWSTSLVVRAMGRFCNTIAFNVHAA